MKRAELRKKIEKYNNQIEIQQPYEKDGELYIQRTDNQREILYLEASCDELRHGLSNYEALLELVKKEYFRNASEKDAVIYALKYESTRFVWHEQRNILKQYFNGYHDNYQREQRKIESINREMQILRDKKEKLKQDLVDFKARKNKLELEVRALKAEISQLKQEIDFLVNRRSELRKEVEQLKQQKSILLNEIPLLKTEKENLEQIIESHKKALELLKINISDGQNFQNKEEIFTELEKVNNRLQQEKMTLYTENRQLKSLCESLTRQINHKNQIIEQYVDEVRESKEKLSKIIRDHKKTEKELFFYKNQSRRLSQIFLEAGHQIKDKLKKNEYEIEKLNQIQIDTLKQIESQNLVVPSEQETKFFLDSKKSSTAQATNSILDQTRNEGDTDYSTLAEAQIKESTDYVEFTLPTEKKIYTKDSIQAYLQKIDRIPTLSVEEEIELARKIADLLELERIREQLTEYESRVPTDNEWAEAAGMPLKDFQRRLFHGRQAKDKMVQSNLRLVVSIAEKYMNRGLSFQDLIQEGSLGLIRAAEKFDHEQGYKFSTYATWWIRQAITRVIADQSRTIRLPVHVYETISRIKKNTKILSQELARKPTEEEIAGRTEVTIEQLRFIAKSVQLPISLETPIGKEGDSRLGDFIEADDEPPEDHVSKNLLREDVENVLNTLNARERDVLRIRYGLDDGRMKTLEEIGQIFNVTRERIRQIEAKALRKLRHPIRNSILKGYVY